MKELLSPLWPAAVVKDEAAAAAISHVLDTVEKIAALSALPSVID